MEYFHLTTPQQNIWNLQKYYEGTAIANLCGAVFFQDKRDEVILCRAVCRFIHSQSGIRLRFHEGGKPRQYVSEEVNEDMPIRTFRSREEFDAYAETCAKDPIGLSEQQMYRFIVFHLEQENRSGILAILSHLISDAWTFGLMANQVDMAYRQLVGEGDVTLLEGDYADFIQSEDAYLASGRYEKDKSYWVGKYPVRPEESPIKMRSASADSVEAGRITRTLPPSLEQGIAAYCKSHPVTEAVLFETAMMIYLSRINPDVQTVTVGVPVLNRSSAKEKEIAGMFVSTMPLTVSVTEDMEIAELTRQITKGHMDLFRHQKYPYADILRRLREKQDFSGSLYDVMISYQNARTKTGADTRWYSNGYSEVPLVIHIDNRDGNDCHTVNVDYQTAVFRNEEIAFLIGRLEYILEQIVGEGVRLVGEIGIVPQREYDKIVYEFNDTYVEYPREKCIHELFMEQAAKTPERIALVFEDKKFTYRQLDEMSNSLAYFLRGKGVEPNDVVPIIARRNWHVIVAMLGILKAGGAYMPVDPDYPIERIKDVIIEAGAKLVLYHQFCGKTGIEMHNISAIDYRYHDALENKNGSTDLCYVIYTSGSTGKPKGICQTHKCLSNLINWQEKETTAIGCNILSSTIITFDVSLQEIMYSLLNGGCLHFTNDDVKMNISKYLNYIEKNKIDTLFITPSYYNMLVKVDTSKKLESIRKIFFAGETLKIGKKVFGQFEQKTVIYNQYGPAETHVATSKIVGNFTNITIGSPIANTQIYILDKSNNHLPIGVAGELCIAGDGVGKGYLNRPELTAERFVPNPFASSENHHGQVMYHTGDSARWRADGEIEYLGRMDTQVKIRGLRIELGEIESVMSSFPGIRLTVVADRKDGDSRQYLVGYYTGEGEIDEKALRAHLSARLPRYMVPNYFMRLDAMPMTASGKTDRKNLPAPQFTIQEEEYVSPVTNTEQRLALIWQKLLSVRKAGRTDDFFELGGDSLLAISALNEIEREFHVEVSIRDIMEQSSLERLAMCIDHAKRAGDNLTACHEEKYVLLPQQKAIYAACQKEPDSLTYNMPAKITLPQTIDRDKLGQSIYQVMERHKILKSYIQVEDDEIYGIYDENAQMQFEEYRNGEEEKFVRAFNLGKAPLIHIGFTEDALLFDMHHIIADGSSLNIILRDIVALYEGRELCQSELWFADYARHFYGLDLKEHKAYFREMLKCEFESLTLPETRNAGHGGGSKTYFLSGEIFGQVREFARANGLTETMVFLGAYGILLSKYTAEEDVLSSVILQNRIHADIKDMAGMFVNTLPVYFSVSGEMREYMRKVKEVVLNLMQYQELPFWDMADAVGMEDKSVVNTLFVYQGDGEKRLSLDGKSLIPQFIDTRTSKFDLSMELTPLDAGCRIRMEYNLARYDGQLMDELADAYIRILGQLDREKVADISVLSDEGYHKIVEGFNDTYVDYPRDKCVHELFSEQARRTPERVALVFEDKEFTYRQLDEMSNSLAHFLRGKGVQPNDVVPIIAKRSWHMVVAMLGILKAGGAYMLIDYQYPTDRVLYLIKECKASTVLVYGYKFKDAVDLKKIDYFEDLKPLESVNRIEDIFCVIHTSGSTGVPKVATLTHKNIVHYIDYSEGFFQGTSQTIATTTITFDAFIQETLVSLCRQNPVILLSEIQITDQVKFEKVVEEYRDSFLFQTPTKLYSYIKNSRSKKFLLKIASFVIGGEVFSQELYDKIKKYNPKGRVYNIYGPTETTICAVVNELKEDIEITIGDPIANTQIYILDKDSNPLPIGVPGELCIAGDGVGKGYLNRPELTAERFVPNPFARPDNHHGKTMYHTGDLARWRRDGEIEYLGRIDTQVKIRGLRIELGEIESVMGSFAGVGLCAVADKRDGTGRQYLVGYYTVAAGACGGTEGSRTDGSRTEGSRADGGKLGQDKAWGQLVSGQEQDRGGTDSGLDEKALRAHLSARLPRYMVPNYFMRLDAMPMTASGKTDRKNLPVPDFTQQTGEYLAPVTGREKELCRLMEELLHVGQVGVTDDFFELGGDSLTAIGFLAKAHDRGIDFALQDIFDHPTVRQLCSHMDEGNRAKVHYEPSDFDKYRVLFSGNVIDEAFVPEKKSLGNVLLTGATGFLGAHVLDRLMQEETGKIYCLVRGGKAARNGSCAGAGTELPDGNNAGNGEDADCSSRLRQILKYYFGERYEGEFAAGTDVEPEGNGGRESGHHHARRIIPIAGDIESETLAGNMPGDVQTVIHAAASVKHYGSYDYFNRVNVEGTRHVVNYARSVGAGLIHVSTLSVSGNSMADDFTVYRSEEGKFFDETSFYIGQPLDNVYIHSKFEAERAVYDAMLEGLDGAVIRVGNLTNRASDYKFQPNYRENAFLTRVKAILEFGLFPDYLMHLYSEFSPIDLTAEGIVKIAQYAGGQSVFHLNSNRPVYFDRFLEVVHGLGISMEVVEGGAFYQALRRTIKDSVTEYIFEAFQNDMDVQGRLLYDSNIRIVNDFTVWFLGKVGFEWNETDMEYIRGYIEYFRGIGYLGV